MRTRLHLLCSAAMPSVRAVAFPDEEPLDPRGREDLSRLSGLLPSCSRVLRSAALCAKQTAEAHALDARSEPQLRECNFGRWAGRALTEIQGQEPDSLAKWLHDPHSSPHGGESFAEVTMRVGSWMESLLAGPESILVITHANIIRAAIAHALGAGPHALLSIDVTPLSRAKISASGGRRRFGARLCL